MSTQLRLSNPAVGKWRGRFVAKRLDGLLDEPRPGAPRRITDAQVERALVRTYCEKAAVREVCVRQILTTDQTNNVGWQVSVVPLDVYQNGGYWGTPAGWYISTTNQVDRRAAADMAEDYVQFLRSHMRPDGKTEAWEWFNPDTGRNANPLYAATVVLPYLFLKAAGLLSGK